MTNRQWLYAKQPAGKIGKDTFQWAEIAIPAPREGEVLVRTRLLSLDAANRAWMMGKTYRDALQFGQVMSGFAIGEVVESRAGGYAKGDIVEGDIGWQEYAALPAHKLEKRTTKAPLEQLIGALSVTGLTAYFGLLEVGRPKPGDIKEQTADALTIMKESLAKAGSSMENVLKVQVSIVDPEKNWDAMNDTYNTFFPKDRPVRSYFGTTGFRRPGQLLQIDCIAYVD